MQASNRTNRLADRTGEAEIPDLLSPRERQRERFVNTNNYRNPEELTKMFNFSEEYEPFTTEEALTFTEAFKLTPKDFGAIAEFLPGRTYEECLKHYYDNKADGRFETESLRQREARHREPKRYPTRDVVKKNMYDYGDENINDVPQHEAWKKNKNLIPLNQEIKGLRQSLPDRVSQQPKRNPLGKQQTVILPRPDLSILQQGFRWPLTVNNEKLLVWLRSVDVLTLLKRWKEQCLVVPETKEQVENMLLITDRPWTARVDQIVDHATHYGDNDFEARLRMKWAKAFVLCANFAVKIVKCNRMFFESLKSNRFSEKDKMIIAVAALFTAYDDLGTDENGFFGILLASPLAEPIPRESRKGWEAKYPFEGEPDEANKMPELGRPSRPMLPPHFPPRRSQHKSSNSNAPSKPTCNSRNLEELDTEVNGGEESEEDSSDGDVGLGEPGDAAGKAYRAKAQGLYQATNKMRAKLREVETQRDEYKAQRDEYKAQRDKYKARLDELDAGTVQGVEDDEGKQDGANTTNLTSKSSRCCHFG